MFRFGAFLFFTVIWQWTVLFYPHVQYRAIVPALYMMMSEDLQLLECRGEEAADNDLSDFIEPIGAEDQLNIAAFPGPLDLKENLTLAVRLG